MSAQNHLEYQVVCFTGTEADLSVSVHTKTERCIGLIFLFFHSFQELRAAAETSALFTHSLHFLHGGHLVVDSAE